MQNGIVFFPNSRNRGDDIQTYAASLLVKNPSFCDREQLHKVKTPTKLLCNGWFMEDAANWPPSTAVHPHFISFHISSKQEKRMTNPNSIAYLKQYEPIGCRDTHTLNLLRQYDVDAYYSGCLTLTLPPFTGNRKDDILFVDVLRTNYSSRYRKAVVKQLIPVDLRGKVQFETHFSNDLHLQDASQRMIAAKELLDRYAKAKVVFTSLIHCALPCLAMGTPVVFIDGGFNNNKAKRDRFGGITDMLTSVSDLNLPYAKRTVMHKIARGMGFYRCNQHQIKTLPKSLFNPSRPTSTHDEIAEKMYESVSNFFSTN